MKKDLFQPAYHYRLRAKIFESGFKTLGQYAEAAGMGVSNISRIINGWEIPSYKASKKLAAPLGITVDEMSELLFDDEGCISSAPEARCNLESIKN